MYLYIFCGVIVLHFCTLPFFRVITRFVGVKPANSFTLLTYISIPFPSLSRDVITIGLVKSVVSLTFLRFNDKIIIVRNPYNSFFI